MSASIGDFMFKILSVMFVSFLLLVSCGDGSNGRYKNLDALEAVNLINQNENLTVLDVRSDQEHGIDSILDSINIDIFSTDFRSRLSYLDKNKEYLVYSRKPEISKKAAVVMYDLGFRNIYNVDASYDEFSLLFRAQ